MMNISYLTELGEYQTLKALRQLFPELSKESSDISRLNRHLLQIVSNAKFVPLRSYDADVELHGLGLNELNSFKPESKNKLRAFLIACHAYILDQHPSTDIQNLKWNSLAPLKEKYRDNEDFRIISSEDEWRSLLQFRNYLVLSLHVVKEKNKVLLEMSAGMLSNFHLCLSGGKPSKQVKRRHAIYHDETQTVVKPRRSNKNATAEGLDGNSSENGGASRKKAKIRNPSPQSSGEIIDNDYKNDDYRLLLLSKVAHHLSQEETEMLMNEPYQGSFTEVAGVVAVGVSKMQVEVAESKTANNTDADVESSDNNIYKSTIP